MVDFASIVYAVGGVAVVLAVIVCILIIVLCRIVYSRRRSKKHQVSTSPECSRGTSMTTLTTTVSTTAEKRYNIIPAFSATGSGRDANSIVKSDTSTTSSNHIRVSDGSASSGNSTKAEVVMETVEPPKGAETKGPYSKIDETTSADYAEIEEEKSTKCTQKGDTLESTAESTISTVSSFNSSMRDSTLSYGGAQDSFLDNLEPGAHNTPRFPIRASAKINLVNADYEQDPNLNHDYEQDPNYEQQTRNKSSLPSHIYQALQQCPQPRKSENETHYRAPEKTLRPLSERLSRVTEHHDYADAIPHSNSLSTPPSQNYDYAKLRESTLDPLPHYTRLDISTKERTRGSGLSYVTTDL